MINQQVDVSFVSVKSLDEVGVESQLVYQNIEAISNDGPLFFCARRLVSQDRLECHFEQFLDLHHFGIVDEQVSI